MVNAAKAVKRRRAVSAINVFQQECFKGQRVRIGTPEYKAVQQRVKDQWQCMSEADREIYAQRAAEQNLHKDVCAKRSLRDVVAAKASTAPGKDLLPRGRIKSVTNCFCSENGELLVFVLILTRRTRSKSQHKRLGQRQLDQSLHQLATHTAWKSGLGISNHVAALDPKYVQEIDFEEAAERIKDAFEYDSQPVQNPESMPRLFCSCQESHPGLCKADDCFHHVQTAVQQFQQCLEEKKVQGCALLKLTVVTAESSSSSSQPSQIVPSTQWFLLGCVSKRPLCHVVGKLVPHQEVANIVTPNVREGSWQLQTMHAVLRDVARRTPGLSADMCVEFCSTAPNHLLVGTRLAQFRVGPRVVLPARTRGVKVTPQLPFGMQLSASRKTPRSKAATAKAKGKCKPEASDAPSFPHAQAQEAEAAQEAAAGALDDAAPDRFAVVLQQMHDRSPLAPGHLHPDAATEVVSVAQSLRGQFVDETEDVVVPSEPSQAARPPMPPVPPMPPIQPPPSSSRFNDTLGLIGYTAAKRRSTCVTCSQPIHKGDDKFEYSHSLTKPHKSLHPECVGQIIPSAVEPSIAWLRAEISSMGLQPSLRDRKLIFQGALETLERSRQWNQP